MKQNPTQVARKSDSPGAVKPRDHAAPDLHGGSPFQSAFCESTREAEALCQRFVRDAVSSARELTGHNFLQPHFHG